MPYLSVLIPVYNRKDALAHCLEALSQQTLARGEFEVLVIDDGSTDQPETLQDRFASRLNLHFIHQAHKNRAAALNNGIRNARGEIILFTDSDMVPTPPLLEKHYAFHQRHPAPNSAMLGYMDWHPELTITPFMQYIVGKGEWQFGYHLLTDGAPVPGIHFWGGNSSVKRQFLLDHGLLDEALSRAEDVELGYRLSQAGVVIIYDASAVNYHRHAVTLRDFCERNHKAGQANVLFAQRHPELCNVLNLFNAPVFSIDVERRGIDLEDAIAKAEFLEQRSPSSLEKTELLHELYHNILYFFLGQGMRDGLQTSFERTSAVCSVIVPISRPAESLSDGMKAEIATLEDRGYECLLVDTAPSLPVPEPLAAGPLRRITPGVLEMCSMAAAQAQGKYLCFMHEKDLAHLTELPELVEFAQSDPQVGLVAGSVASDSKSSLSSDTVVISRPLFFECGGFDNIGGGRAGFTLPLAHKVRKLGRRIVSPEMPLPDVWADHHPKADGKMEDGRGKMERGKGKEGKMERGNQSCLVGIIIVTYNSAPMLRTCLESVFQYTQVPAELIVVDNASTDETRAILAEYQERITTISNAENKGFARACNQGIRASSGEYVVLLNPDTVVTPGWLARLIAHFRPDVGAVGPVSNYVAGLQKAHFYLPKNLPENIGLVELSDLLVENNRGNAVETKLLIGFCTVLRRQVLDEIGLLDEDLFLGNDDLDLSWRLRQRGYRLLVATDTFIYHEGQISFKSETSAKTSRLVQESTDRLYAKLEAHYGHGNVPPPMELWGIDWFKPTQAQFRSEEAPTAEQRLTSIIILTCNQLDHTRLCLQSIHRHTPEPHELIIVDNGSTDGTLDYLRDYMASHDNVRVIANNHNRGFAAGNNYGLALAGGEFVLLLNNDTIMTRGWLDRMLAVFERYPRTGIVGPMSNYVSGPQQVPDACYRTQAEMETFAARWAAEHSGQSVPLTRVVGFCMLVRREVIDRIGGLDERFGNGNFEDDDLCVRAALTGYETRIAQDVFIHHTGGQTFKGANIDYRQSLLRNWELFKAKWGIPADTPYEKGYRLPFQLPDGVSLYVPLPDVNADHQPDGDERWWQERPPAVSRGAEELTGEGGRKMENGEWKMEDGEWKMEDGEWKMEGGEGKRGISGRGKKEGGGWRMENGEWRVEGGEGNKGISGEGKKEVEVVPSISNFQPPTSNFQSPTSNFQSPISNLLQQADAAIARDDLPAAWTILEQAVAAHPDSVELRAALASVAMAQGDHSGAQEQLISAIEMAPEEPELHNQLGTTYYSAGDHQMAEQAFQQALDLDPVNLNARTNLAEMARRDGRYDEAARHYIQALEEHPDDVELLVAFGRLAVEIGEPDTAQAAFQRALANDPSREDVRQMVEALERRTTNDQRPTTKDVTRDTQHEIGNTQRTMASSDEQPSSHPSPDDLMAEANAAVARGDLSAAAPALEACIDHYPTYPDAYVALASVASAQDDHGRAQELLLTAIELDSDRPELLNQLGCALFAEGQVEYAEQAFREALELMPDDPDATVNLAEVYRSQQRYDEAARRLTNALRKYPNDVNVLVAFGYLSMEIDEPEAAQMAFEKATKLDPSREDVRQALGRLEVTG